MGIHTSLCQLVACLNHLLILDFHPGTIRNQVRLCFPCLVINHINLTLLLRIFNMSHTCDFCDNRKSLGLTRLEKLLDTRKTLCDIAAGHTAGMECTHRKLRTRLSDRLCCNDTD